ncbi:hypothetical protein ABZ078_26580 [Streptomyces sp. NPDC006385]|uniref:hypothetical protein n=1 Tax=Streptomyces sp. NPDC006385 TaxID=3156761 RepID=UPI0033A002FA
MTGTPPPSPPSRSPGYSDTRPSAPGELPFSTSQLSALARPLTWQQRAALRVLARTPSRIRQRDNGSLYVDTHSSTHIAITTWRALERKGLAHRDHAAHPASLIGQRLALTRKGLAVLNHLARATFPSSATQLWPPAPPPQYTSLPSAQGARPPHAPRR